MQPAPHHSRTRRTIHIAGLVLLALASAPFVLIGMLGAIEKGRR